MGYKHWAWKDGVKGPSEGPASPQHLSGFQVLITPATCNMHEVHIAGKIHTQENAHSTNWSLIPIECFSFMSFLSLAIHHGREERHGRSMR